MSVPYLKLAEMIEMQILTGQLSAGEKLPSLRELAERHELKPNAVQRSLKVLTAKGVVESKHGAGYYVARRNEGRSDRPRIAVIHHRGEELSTSTCSGFVLRGIQAEAERREASLVIHYGVSLGIRDGQLEQLLEHAHREADAMILLGAFDMIPRSFNCKVPMVGVMMQQSCRQQASLVDLDPFTAAELAVDYFHQAGISRVRVHESALCYKNIRVAAFVNAWDGEIELIRCDWPVTFYDDFPEDCGYWFENGVLANDFARHFRSLHQADFARRRRVISLDGRSLLIDSYLPMNSITPDWEDIGRIALDEAFRRLREPGGGMRRIHVNVNLKLVQ